jgi:autotransporter-associated beta strand protein
MPVSAGGTASFNATGTGNGILVDQLSAMGLITAGTADGDATIVNSAAISFAGTVAGLFSLSALSGGISDGGPVSATGGLEITAPGSSSLAQALAGPGGLTFNGTGTLAVSGANTFTGDTNINAGTLVLTGSLAKSDVIVAGGTLRGTGDMASLSAKGGTVRPGQSAGSFFSSGPANLGAGNNYVVEVNGTASGTGYSQIVSDGVTLAGTLGLVQTVSFMPMIGSHYTIIDNTGALPVSGTFAGLPEGATVNLGSQRFIITYQGGTGANDVVLTAINTVPTPTGGIVTAPFSLSPGNLVTAVTGGYVQFSTSAGINRQFKPFPGYGGMLAINAVDRTGDGVADSLAVGVATPGNRPRLMVIDAATGRVATNGYAFAYEFLGGMSISSGMANLGGINTSVLLVGAGPGANPLVRVFNSVNGTLIKQFNAFSATYSGGINVAVSNPDTLGQSIAVVSARTGSRVSAFDIDNPTITVANFEAFTTMMNGVSISVGDINGDGLNEIVVGTGSGTSPLVRTYTSSGVFISQFQPFATGYTGGVDVALADFDADGQLEFVTAAASGTRGRLIVYKGDPVSVIYSAFQTISNSNLVAATNLTVTI